MNKKREIGTEENGNKWSEMKKKETIQTIARRNFSVHAVQLIYSSSSNGPELLAHDARP